MALPRRTKRELDIGLRGLRNRSGLLQSAAARKMGVEVSRFKQWESARTKPPVDMLPVIAEVLGATVYEVLDAVLETIRTNDNRVGSDDDAGDGDDAGEGEV